MTYIMKPLSFAPDALAGLSERLIVSHYENNYGGAVKRLNAITEQLRSLDYATAPVYVINGLKREERGQDQSGCPCPRGDRGEASTRGGKAMLDKRLRVVGFVLLMAAALSSAQEPKPDATSEYRLGFDDLASGTLPEGWKIDATNPGGKLAEWKVMADGQAPSIPNVLSLMRTDDRSSGVFNLCWTNVILFQDGTIEVSLRANTGKEDQGGGVIWRVRDANNYYISRYNPLESNFRIYYVKDGRRKQLASAGRIGIAAGEWFRLKIVHQGARIEGYLNGQKFLEATDETFMEPGGVGFWSKADATSSFDELLVVNAARN